MGLEQVMPIPEPIPIPIPIFNVPVSDPLLSIFVPIPIKNERICFLNSATAPIPNMDRPHIYAAGKRRSTFVRLVFNRFYGYMFSHFGLSAQTSLISTVFITYKVQVGMYFVLQLAYSLSCFLLC